MKTVPHLIGVLDLMGGVAVRAVGGRRDEYRPVRGGLCDSAEPGRIAGAFRERYGIERLYVADLDAILGRGANDKVISDLAADGFRLAVDAGLQSAEDARRLADLGIEAIVAGSETVAGPEVLAEIVRELGTERVAFSLDLAGGQPLGSTSAWDRSGWSEESPVRIAEAVAAVGIERLIVLDVRHVGLAGGPATAGLCRRIRDAAPPLRIWTGGGVRTEEDVEALLSAGAEGVLVATALHDGTL